MRINLIFIFICFSIYTYGQGADSRLSDEKIKDITCQICDDIIEAREEAYDIPKWQETMEETLGFNGTKEEFIKYFNNFLNVYNNKLICPKFQVASNIYPSQHLFKRILAAGMNETYEEYFFNLENGDVDFNTYQIIDGKKETILDWIIKWIDLGRGDKDELYDVLTALEDELGAKYGRDLPN